MSNCTTPRFTFSCQRCCVALGTFEGRMLTLAGAKPKVVSKTVVTCHLCGFRTKWFPPKGKDDER